MKREFLWAGWLILTLLICAVVIYFMSERNAPETLWDGNPKMERAFPP
jgi:hypothetical protein